MAVSLWKKLSYILGLLAIGVLFGLVVFSANIEIRDLDLWLHLKMGEFIVQHHYVPQVDVLSCSISGKPWINHEWLFQVIVYLVNKYTGLDGLISMQAIIVSITFLILLFLGYNKEKQLGAIFILLLVMMVYRQRFTIRPDIFSLLFFALYIHVLALHINKKWSVPLLFFMQVLWTNFHGFSFFGPFMVLVGIGAEFLKRHAKLPWQWNEAGRLTDEEYARLKTIFVFVLIASLFNPATLKGAWYPVSVLIKIPGESRIFFQRIQELQPPIDLQAFFSSRQQLHYKILIILSALSFVFNRRKIDIGDFFIWMIFLYVSLVAIRNIVFFSFASYLVCMTNFTTVRLDRIVPLRFTERKFQYITSAILKTLLILWMVRYGAAISKMGYFDFDKYEMKSEYGGVTQRGYPDKAVDFIIANKIKGNFFNDFNSGAYLIGRCFPDIKVFIDGRTEVYGAEFFKTYEKVWVDGDEKTLEEITKKYHLTGALLNSVYVPVVEKTLNTFYKSKGWVLVYLGYDAVIFLRDIPENKELIDKFRIDLSKWQANEVDLKELGLRNVTPYRNLNRAFTLEALGFKDAALAEVLAALKVAPDYTDAHRLAGRIYGEKDDYQKAFESFRMAAMLAPSHIETRSNLALAYYKIGDFKHAIKQYSLITQRLPKSPKAYFMLSKIYAEDGQYKEALEILRKAKRLAPENVVEILEVGDVIYKKEKFRFAIEAYETALSAKKDLATVHNKIGLCYQSLGLAEEAKKQFKEGLKVDSSDKELKKNLKALTPSRGKLYKKKKG